MKRLLIAGVMAAVSLYPSLCMASYLIQLKNGKEILVENYWEEANQIKFYQYGGLVAIAKEEIHAIRESSKPYAEKPLPAPKPKPVTAETEPEADTTKGSEEGEKEEEGDVEKQIQKELNLLRDRYDSTFLMTTEELDQLYQDLTALRDKLFAPDLVNTHVEELEEISDMRFEVEAMRESRSR